MIRNLLRRQQSSKTSPDACSEKVFSRPKSDQNSFKMCRETKMFQIALETRINGVTGVTLCFEIKKLSHRKNDLENTVPKRLDNNPTLEAARGSAKCWKLDPNGLGEIFRVWSSRGDWSVLARDKLKNSKNFPVDWNVNHHQNTTLQRLGDSPTPGVAVALAKCWNSRHVFLMKSVKSGRQPDPGVRTH